MYQYVVLWSCLFWQWLICEFFFPQWQWLKITDMWKWPVWDCLKLGLSVVYPNMPTSSGKTSSTMLFLGRRLPNICREPHVVSPNGKPSIRDSLSQWMGTSSPETRASWKGEAVQQLKLVNLTLQWFYGRFSVISTISWLWPRFLHDSHHWGTTKLVKFARI